MEEYNDKDQTIEFRPVKEEKEYVSRENGSVYNEGRKERNVRRESEKSNRPLIYLALVLAILLVIAIAVGIIILNKDNAVKNNEPLEMEPPVIEIEEEEEVSKEEVKINYYNVVFYGDSVIKTQDGYSVLADLYDDSFNKKDNRKLYITEETDIRENGNRLSASGLVYAIESMAGEGVVFEAKIRENDNMVVSVYYDGSFKEEMNPPEEEIPQENGEEIPPVEENIDGEEPIIGENDSQSE